MATGTSGEAGASTGAFWLESIFGAYSAYQTAEGLRKYGEYQQDVYKLNARLAEVQARDALFRGREAQKRYAEEASKVMGTQRVRAAAQGVSLASGSPAELQAEAMRASMMDVLQIENNAWREAMGYKAQAAGALAEGAMRRAAAESQAMSTLTTRAVKLTSDITDRYAGEGVDSGVSEGKWAPTPEEGGVEIDRSSKAAFFRTQGKWYRNYTTMSATEIRKQLERDWASTRSA